MNIQAPFLASDLEELHARLLSKARRVIPMREVASGDHAKEAIAVRHDVDDNQGSLDTALALAEWEAAHGYRTTYYLLHDSHYWPRAQDAAGQLEELGHEVGIHVNALAVALQTGRDPHQILADAIFELGYEATITGCVAHGDRLCHVVGFVNDEMFTESRRPSCGDADRTLTLDDTHVSIAPVSRTLYGLQYDASWLSRGDYLSDSGGHWSQPFEAVAESWPLRGQLHCLIHPDWWSHAFSKVGV